MNLAIVNIVVHFELWVCEAVLDVQMTSQPAR